MFNTSYCFLDLFAYKMANKTYKSFDKFMSTIGCFRLAAQINWLTPFCNPPYFEN
jgi:hypothetical protein